MSVLVTPPAPDFTKPAVLPNGSFDGVFNFHKWKEIVLLY